jgi:hypothetical protein
MKNAQLSIYVYGGYLLASGIGLLFFPGLILEILGITGSAGPWIRLFGLLAAEIGFYFAMSAKKELVAFYSLTVFGRIFTALAFSVLVVINIAPVQFLLFAFVDIVSAIWTLLANMSAKRAR